MSAEKISNTKDKYTKKDHKRKGKKNWRKNIDVTNANDSLHAISTEERLHGKRIKSKADSELFFVDSIGCEESGKKTRQLTIDKILTPNSKISLVSEQKIKSKGSILSKETRKQIKSRLKAENLKQKDHSNSKVTESPWNDDLQPVLKQDRKSAIISNIHPGSSYRPTPQDHLSAIKKAIAIEKGRTRNKKKPIQSQISEITIDEPKTEVSPDFVSLEPYPLMSDAKKKRLARKKSKQERKVEKKIKISKKKRELRKKQEIEENELEKALNEPLKVQKQKKKKPKRQKIPSNYEPPMFPVATSDSIAGSLRTVKTEGSLFSDRIKHFQLKGLVSIPNK